MDAMNVLRATLVGLGLAFGPFPLAGSSISAQDLAKTSAQAPAWLEEKWPFPIDQWGTGLAFRCAADQCGTDVHLYLRAKIGFCRCATGVSDDDEIDRVGDLELIGMDSRPLAPGHAVTVGIMTGRARLFALQRPFRSPIPILAIALANQCDAIIATVIAEPDLAQAHEREALDFLRTARVQHWVEAQAGSE
jgi:hypothetical protein